jgi:hypothetical protein
MQYDKNSASFPWPLRVEPNAKGAFSAIAVHFRGNNDFHSVFKGFLRILEDALTYGSLLAKNITKQSIFNLLYDFIPGLCALYCTEYDEDLISYLRKIKINDIYLDNEVDDWLQQRLIKQQGNVNHDFYWLDLNVCKVFTV